MTGRLTPSGGPNRGKGGKAAGRDGQDTKRGTKNVGAGTPKGGASKGGAPKATGSVKAVAPDLGDDDDLLDAAEPAAEAAKALPERRRKVLLGALLVAVAGGAAYMTYGAPDVDAAPAGAEAGPARQPGAPQVTVVNTVGGGAPGAGDSAGPAAGAATPANPAAPNASPGAGADSAAADADTVVLEREVYGYAGTGRRDPFRPLIVTTVLRPFASELRLTAVAYDPTGAGSVAILRDVNTKAQHRVRVGQLVGRMRVLRIQPKAVVFAVEELGFSRRETLTLQDTSGTRQP